MWNCQKIFKLVSVAILVHTSLLSLYVVKASTSRDAPALDESLLYDVLDALEKTAKFFAEDYADLNLDGFYGIRLCQGQIKEILETCTNCPSDLITRLQELQDQLEDLLENAASYVENDDPETFKSFLPMIKEPFTAEYIPETFGEVGPPETESLNTSYIGWLGNACMNALMGTYALFGIEFPQCTITKKCLSYMTTEKAGNYYITHQLLYLIVAQKNGCATSLESLVSQGQGDSVRDMERKRCRKIYDGARLEAANGDVHVLSQDLFLEQVLLCGILGFEDFLSTSWMRMVLKWQTPSGCFAVPEELLDRLDSVKRGLNTAQETKATGRKLLTERIMGDGCLSHKTGLAAGTLALFARYITTQMYM